MTRTINSGFGIVRFNDRQGLLGPNEKGVIIATGESRVAEWLRDYVQPCMGRQYVLRCAETASIFNTLVHIPGMAMVFIEVGFFGDAMIGVLNRLKKQYPKLQLVLFTVSDIPLEGLARYLYWGDGSFISLRDEPEELRRHVKVIFEGGKRAPEDLLKAMRDYDGLSMIEPYLTHTEIEVVRFVAQEKTRKEIAYCLKISDSTVKNHLDSIRRKFGIHNMVGILKLAVMQGILPENELRSCRFMGKGYLLK